MDRWLVTGLGNPGDKYAATRHNIGFVVLDRLAESNSISMAIKDDAASGRGHLGRISVMLLKPLTYMNLSGAAVKKALSKFNLLRDGEVCNLIVVHDDLDMAPGVVKIRRGGSSGGHRGIESIIKETGTREFIRVKIGIGRDSTMPVEDYVLRKFRPDEKGAVREGVELAEKAVEVIISEGIEKAMNRFNRSPKTEK